MQVQKNTAHSQSSSSAEKTEPRRRRAPAFRESKSDATGSTPSGAVRKRNAAYQSLETQSEIHNENWRKRNAGWNLFYHLKLAALELGEELRSDRPYSPFLLLLLLEGLMIFCGAAFLYSNSSSYMLQRHMLWLALGFGLGFLVYLLPIRIIVQCIPYFALLALALNALPQIPGLKLANDGSPRWIYLWGFSFQTSETLRLMVVLYFARRISLDLHNYRQQPGKTRQHTDYYPKVLWLPLVYLLLASILVILQKDYSTSVLLMVVASAMAMLVGSWLTLLLIVLAIVLLTFVAMLFMGQTFRINRIYEWREGSGEQINWVYDALGQGFWFGRGLGQGRSKYLVPAEMTDFPLAAVGEEAGFVGIVLTFLLFFAFALTGFALAKGSRMPFVRYATAGLTGLIFTQALVNFAVSSGILPVTGQPLPFFSVGGSSTLTSLIILGLLNSFNRPSRKLHFETREQPTRGRRAKGTEDKDIKNFGQGRANRREREPAAWLSAEVP